MHPLWAEYWLYPRPFRAQALTYFKNKFPELQVKGNITDGYKFHFDTEEEKLLWMLKHL
jgi:hypothetical protein